MTMLAHVRSATVIALLALFVLLVAVGKENHQRAGQWCAGMGLRPTAVAVLPQPLIPADATVCTR